MGINSSVFPSGFLCCRFSLHMDIKNISFHDLRYYAVSNYSNHTTIVRYDIRLGTVKEFPNFRLNKKSVSAV